MGDLSEVCSRVVGLRSFERLLQPATGQVAGAET